MTKLETMDIIVREADTFRRERPNLTTVSAASSLEALSQLSFDKPDVEFDVARAAVAEARIDLRVAAMLIASTMNKIGWQGWWPATAPTCTC